MSAICLLMVRSCPTKKLSPLLLISRAIGRPRSWRHRRKSLCSDRTKLPDYGLYLYYESFKIYIFAGTDFMKLWLAVAALAAASSFAYAADTAITVYQDHNCGRSEE